MPSVKICGVTDPVVVDTALTGGARFLGFVFFDKSPRALTIERARPLMQRARGRAETVVVVVDAADAQLADIASQLKPDWIQAHGAETPARLAAIRPFAARGVIKAFGVGTAEDLVRVAPFEAIADMMLFDAKPPAGASRPGGNAAAFDWTILKGRRFSKPWLLSGGLNPENVAQAMALSGADLVDVSSGVESAPGLKDPTRIVAFLTAAKAGPQL